MSDSTMMSCCHLGALQAAIMGMEIDDRIYSAKPEQLLEMHQESLKNMLAIIGGERNEEFQKTIDGFDESKPF